MTVTKQELAALEMRMTATEKRMSALEVDQPQVAELVELLESVKSALKLFAVAGKVLKWIAALVAALASAYFSIKKLLS